VEQLGQRRARDRKETDVAMLQMNADAVEIVGPEGAGLAPFGPVRPQHEVIDNELALARKQIGERGFAVFGPVK